MTPVALYLSDYIAQNGASVEAPARCTGCLEHLAVASDGVNDYCMVCWAGMQGYDQAECKMAAGILRGAIKGAIEAGVDMDLIRHVVEACLEQGGD